MYHHSWRAISRAASFSCSTSHALFSIVIRHESALFFEQRVDYHHGDKTHRSNRISEEISHTLKALQNTRGSQKLSDFDRALNSSLRHLHGRVHTGILGQVLKHQHEPSTAMALFAWANSQPFFSPNLLVYSIMIRICGRARMFDQVERYLLEIKGRGLSPDVYLFTDLIKSYGRGNRVKQALEYFEEMKRSRIPPNAYTYSVMIDLMSKEGLNDKAFELFKEMKDRGIACNTVVYNTVISVCARTGRLKEAHSIFKSMNSLGYKPCIYTYNTLVDMYQKAGRFDAAMQLFEEMMEKGINPDIITFTSLLHMQNSKKCQGITVEKLLHNMHDARISPDLVWFSALVNMHVKEGRMDIAETIVRNMLKSGIVANSVLFNSLMVGYLGAGDYDAVDNLFNTMDALHVLPDIDTYTQMLHFYNRCENENAQSLIFELLSKTRQPVHDLVQLILQNRPQDRKLFTEIALLEARLRSLLMDFDREKRLSFVDAFMELVITKKHAMCMQLWRVMRSFGFSEVEYETKRWLSSKTWLLDLHGMSSITAVAVVRMELMLLRESSLTKESGLVQFCDFPATLVIVTGKSQEKTAESYGHARIRCCVHEFLRSTSSPFVVHSSNEGRLVSRGVDVRNWLKNGEVWSKVRLAHAQFKKEGDADLSAEADSTFDLGRKLSQLAVANSSGGAVSSFFSLTTPTSGVYEVIVGGGGGGFAVGGGAATGGAAAAPAAEKEEEKKEEEKEESDEDMGFSLFD